jgi:predicted nucleic-acid-binding Zn-ribbon protein
MKHSNLCPKCNFTDIIRIPARIPATTSENIIQVGLMTRAVRVTRYVCATCGFSEEWIESLDEIEKLRNRHEPAPADQQES